MTDVRHTPAPSPWRGACHHCGGQLMRVHRRPIAGGLHLWAAGSATLMVTGIALMAVLGAHRWPFGMALFLLGLWIGLHRFEHWQCRRCRTMYRAVVGDDERSAETDKVLRVGAPSGR
ncbi:MAG TPA: hypothetical protein VFV64_09380 [Permianibacter sp.]|nr:hypothetical protein [Permianibacter sp.]